MTVPDRQLLTNAVIAFVASGTGKQCGDHKAPLDAPHPYNVVYVISGGQFWGPGLAAPDSNADFVYQVDSVALRRDQVEWLADRARRTVLARSSSGAFQVSFVAPAGLKVADRAPDGGPGGVESEGVPPNQVFSIAERFVFRVVAA